MPTILNIDEFCKDLKEVTSPKAWEKKKFNPVGLFSEQIFGPLKNYTCQCGKYYGYSKSGNTCETCGVDIVNSIERRRRFAKIKLPLKVVNPLMYDLICETAGSSVKSNIDKLMKDEKSILCKDEEGYFISEQVREGVTQTWEKTDAIFEIVRYFSDLYKDQDLTWKIINENLSSLLMEYIIVLPPDLRPTAKDSQRNNQYSDEINRYYCDILTKRESMRRTILDIQRDKSLYYTYYRQLQKDANKLYDYILEKLSKKEGLLRGNILGKRVDFSGRAVITPDPTLNIDDCVLPYVMVLEIYKLQIASKLIRTGKFKIFNEAADYITKCCEIHDESLFEISKEVTKGEVCILNRQPSLHRLSMLG
jgi:DNA-directed RNA polymerase subunit beta'